MANDYGQTVPILTDRGSRSGFRLAFSVQREHKKPLARSYVLRKIARAMRDWLPTQQITRQVSQAVAEVPEPVLLYLPVGPLRLDYFAFRFLFAGQSHRRTWSVTARSRSSPIRSRYTAAID